MKRLEERADKLFRDHVKARDGRCLMASFACWGELECAHIIRRSFKATRWEPINAVTLCSEHHRWYTEHPLAWTAWATEHLGPDTYAALVERAYKGSRPDVRAIVEDLRRRAA